MDEAGATVGVGPLRRGAPALLVAALRAATAWTSGAPSTSASISSCPPGAACALPSTASSTSSPTTRAPQDYGPLVVLRHEPADGTAFFTLYGHLSEDTLRGPGGRTARSRAVSRSREWAAPPSQRRLAAARPLPARPRPRWASGRRLPRRRRWPRERRAVERALCPTPTCSSASRRSASRPRAPLDARRRSPRGERLLGRNLSLSYRAPLKIVRGFRQYLYDETGRAYLDVYNNVPLVGHGHPRVVRAAQEQLALLNTNTRYLHDNVAALRRAARRACCPSRCASATSSTRAARRTSWPCAWPGRRTGRDDVIVLEHAYHGHTPTPRRRQPLQVRRARAAAGAQDCVHVAPLPDDYRGRYRRDDPEAGREVRRPRGGDRRAACGDGRGPAAFLAETLPSVGGQIVLPPGYLAEAYRHVRAAGGVCIADEVQVGFGRLGTHFWGFETQGVVPDIVVLGKPIGNGFPLARRGHHRARSPTPSTTAWSSSAPSAATRWPARRAWPCSTCSRTRACRSAPAGSGATCSPGLAELAGRGTRWSATSRGSGLFLGVELVRDRATLRAGHRGGRLRGQPPARARRPDRHRRPLRQRAEDPPAARSLEAATPTSSSPPSTRCSPKTRSGPPVS